jgi:hypothetical protein
MRSPVRHPEQADVKQMRDAGCRPPGQAFMRADDPAKRPLFGK